MSLINLKLKVANLLKKLLRVVKLTKRPQRTPALRLNQTRKTQLKQRKTLRVIPTLATKMKTNLKQRTLKVKTSQN